MAEFNETIRINPHNAGAYVGIGQLQTNTGNFAEAEKAFQKALEISPLDDSAYNGQGFAFEKQDLPAKALSVFKKAIEVNPTVPFGYVNVARILEKMGQPSEAIKNLLAADKFLLAGPEKQRLKNEIARITQQMQRN